jgi:hypothetical protein
MRKLVMRLLIGGLILTGAAACGTAASSTASAPSASNVTGRWTGTYVFEPVRGKWHSDGELHPEWQPVEGHPGSAGAK